jgi:hypothetical protein
MVATTSAALRAATGSTGAGATRRCYQTITAMMVGTATVNMAAWT